MPAYLTFALVAPLASFGEIAVGERRSTWDRPGRSAVLGLIGACLGVDRADDDGQAALADGYGLAMACVAGGELMADYHTAQVPPRRRGRRFPTRAAELAASDLSTVLSRRDYRSGAWHLAALWERPGARWPLTLIQESMERPRFTPYLGRKSCPLGLPLGPEISTADDPIAALIARHTEGREIGFRPRALTGAKHLRVVIDADEISESDARRRRVEFRRDQPRSRSRWQFDLREEALLEVPLP